jgi:hypothetical protein
VRVLSDLSVAATADGIAPELGSFYADEKRRLILGFEVPAVAQARAPTGSGHRAMTVLARQSPVDSR